MASTPKIIAGTVPGVLDPSQSLRILRNPSNTLIFASFDPRTARGQSRIADIGKLSLAEESGSSARRVVIEITPSGDSYWRFIPKANKEDGCVDEGTWPRIIDICGELVEFSQDQWDIYKLDPEYECFVRMPPDKSFISRKQTHSQKQDSKPHEPSPRPDTPPPHTPKPKRRISGSPPSDNFRSKRGKLDVQVEIKASQNTTTKSFDFDDADGVDFMAIDEPERPVPRPAGPIPQRPAMSTRRQEMVQSQKLRRENITKATSKLSSRGQTPYDGPEPGGKRRARGSSEPVAPSSGAAWTSSEHFPSKRVRRVSPQALQQPSAKHMAHGRKKTERMERVMQERRKAKEDEIMRAVYSDFLASVQESANGDVKVDQVLDEPSTRPEPQEQSLEGNTNQELDEGAVRRTAIAESVAKLAELERDRPLWEEHARRRQAKEAAEDMERKAKAEERRRAAAQQAKAIRHAQVQKAEEERQRSEAAKWEQENSTRLKKERERQRREAKWNFGMWTANRALERYCELCEIFDQTKFSIDNPMTFADVPWPVLHKPAGLTVEDVDWTAVEEFFEAVRPFLGSPEYKVLLEKSHKRFHPDRWRSRGLLQSMQETSERGILEVAANTVAQAVTPLWTALRG